MSALQQGAAPAFIDLDVTAPPDVLGGWLVCLLTLAVYSFLYRDNPFYKLAEHIFVGVGTAWYTMEFYESGVLDALFHYLHGAFTHTGPTWQVGGYEVAVGWAIAWRFVAVALSFMLLARLFVRDAWISRWPLALMVGIYAALKMTAETQARLVSQVGETMSPIAPTGVNAVGVTGRLIFVFGLIAVLGHFLFTFRRTKFLGGVSRAGIVILMLTFGGMFGFTVLGRIALLIERISTLESYTEPRYSLAAGGWAGLTPPFLIGGIMVLVLALSALTRRRSATPLPPA